MRAFRLKRLKHALAVADGAADVVLESGRWFDRFHAGQEPVELREFFEFRTGGRIVRQAELQCGRFLRGRVAVDFTVEVVPIPVL